jgi:alpha-beta hydrolase superfamily lysophospholipase
VESFLGLGGVRLYLESWLPVGLEAGPRAAVVFCHGGNNHCSLPAIRRWSKAVTEAGFASYLFDARGFGRSQGRPMHVGSFAEPRGDLAALLHLVRTRHDGVKVFAAGCSYGALTVLDQAIHCPELLDGVVAMSISTGGGQAAGRAVKAMGAAGALLPRLTLPASPVDALCPRTMTLGFVRQVLVKRGPALAGELPELKLPLLHQAGALDPIAPPDPGLAARTGSADATFKLYQASGHDLLAEPDHEAVIADALGWIKQRS